MAKNKFHALVLGSSGLVGFHTTKLLLENDHYEKIYAISRKGIPLQDPRLIQIKADFNTVDQHLTDLRADHVFSCLGSTRKKTPDPKDYYQVDHDYPLKVAAIARQNGAHTLCLVSSIGANPSSRLFYSRLKGKTEESLLGLHYPSYHFFRPSLITGSRGESRPAEKMAALVARLLDPLLLGKFKKYRSIPGESIAKAMIQVSNQPAAGVHYYYTDQIIQLT